MKESIAVIMSTYNGERYLVEQLESILNQNLADVELSIIIRDDGSTDNTVSMIKEFQKSHKNIELITGINCGYVQSFLTILSALKHRKQKFNFYALADQDDYWDKDKLQVAIDAIKQEKLAIPLLYESVSRIADEHLRFIKVSNVPQKAISIFNTAIQTCAAGHTYVFNDLLLQCISDNINTQLIYGHDSLLTNIAIIYGKVIFDSEPHVSYRQHGKNQLGTSNNGPVQWMLARLRRIRKGDSKLYANQIKHIYAIYNPEMGDEVINEFESFFSNQKSFFSRIKYMCKTRFYRQGRIENIAFKLLYILGGYNVYD